jgi:hypothetical protein
LILIIEIKHVATTVALSVKNPNIDQWTYAVPSKSANQKPCENNVEVLKGAALGSNRFGGAEV